MTNHMELDTGMDRLRKWVTLFQDADEEIYLTDITNQQAYEWMKEEIPLLECPDEDMERTYYFRWWTYRKHVRKTQDGYVITEFLPKVPWSGRYNTINAALGHHLREGRWLKNASRYLGEDLSFFLDGKDEGRKYSVDFIHAISEYDAVTGACMPDREWIGKLCRYYEAWEKEHGLANGLFWSYDDADAMEYSISGTRNGKMVKGIRPTLNSYLYADAMAIAGFAERAGEEKIAKEYTRKAENLQKAINETLWDGSFYKALHPPKEDFTGIDRIRKEEIVKELIGYIPFVYGIPYAEYLPAFELLQDSACFSTPVGITTAQQSHEKFLFEAAHECLWNGYIWPFAISQTLNALRYVILHASCEKKQVENYQKIYLDVFEKYVKMHVLTENGKTKPWIDEVMHPFRREWTSRTYLKDRKWPEALGGYERGKDYNHSAFCDHLITGILGVTPGEKELIVRPSIPDTWNYFRLQHLHIQGRNYTVFYDKTGEKYHSGTGIHVREE